jgi:hypothetical protein
MKSWICVAVAALGLAGASAGALADEQAVTIKSGETVMIGAHATSIGIHCAAGPIPQIKVQTAPAGGLVEVRRQSFKADTKIAGSSPCPLQAQLGAVIYYTAKKGFRGTDRVTYRVSYWRHVTPVVNTQTVSITVE